MGIHHYSSILEKSRQDLYGLKSTYKIPNHPNKNSIAQREYFQSHTNEIASRLKLPKEEVLPSLFTRVLFQRGATYRKLEAILDESRKQFYEVDEPHKLYAIAGYIDYLSKKENCNQIGKLIAKDRQETSSELGGLVQALSGQIQLTQIPARKFTQNELFTARLMDPYFDPDDTYMSPESSANKPRIGTWHIHLDAQDHASASGTDTTNILRQSKDQVHAVISDLNNNRFNVNLYFYLTTSSDAKIFDIDIGNYSYRP